MEERGRVGGARPREFARELREQRLDAVRRGVPEACAGLDGISHVAVAVRLHGLPTSRPRRRRDPSASIRAAAYSSQSPAPVTRTSTRTDDAGVAAMVFSAGGADPPHRRESAEDFLLVGVAIL